MNISSSQQIFKVIHEKSRFVEGSDPAWIWRCMLEQLRLDQAVGRCPLLRASVNVEAIVTLSPQLSEAAH
jgi:hypothetical protein